MRFLAEELLHDLLDLRHADHAADEHDFVDVGRRHASVLHAGLHRRDGALDKVIDELLKLRARDLRVEMLRTGSVRRDERQVHFGLHLRRQFDLRLFGGFLQALQRKAILAQVNALFLLELVSKEIDDAHVEVFTTEERVTIRGFHFEDAVTDLEDRDIERTTTKVVHGNRAGLLLVEAIGECSRRRLVDDAQDFKAGDAACVLRGLALRVVEVGGNRDDSLRDLLAEISLGRLFHLLQRVGRDL